MDKKAKLLARPVEEDTVILRETFVTFSDFTGILEQWRWESISASSLVLLKEDVANLQREELIQLLFSQMQLSLDSKHTYKESGDYVYLNFGFTVN